MKKKKNDYVCIHNHHLSEIRKNHLKNQFINHMFYYMLINLNEKYN